MLPITHCHIALRNIGTGALIGVLRVPNWSPEDPEDVTRDLVTETFDTDPNGMRPFQQSTDQSCGTFTWGPLMGLWEWLDFGEQPPTRNEVWATNVYHLILKDQVGVEP